MITRRLTLMRLGLPALIAFVFAFGALTSASAAAQPADAGPGTGYAPAGDQDGGDAGHGAAPQQLSDVEAVLALCSGDGDGGAPTFDSPSLGILCDVYTRLADVLPHEVMRGLARAIAVHADQVAHGWRDRLASSDIPARIRDSNAAKLCRRVLHDALDDGADASADATDALLARCRAFLTGDGADDGSLSAAEICTLLADTGVLDRSPSLAKRCRAAVGGGDQDSGDAPARVCIRLRDSGAAADHPVLARRCREFFSSLDGDGDDGDIAPTAQACIRLREAGTAAEHPALAKACRRLADLSADTDGGDDEGVDESVGDGDHDRGRDALGADRGDGDDHGGDGGDVDDAGDGDEAGDKSTDD